ELRTKIDTACRTAEEFTKLRYKIIDKKRRQMARLKWTTVCWCRTEMTPTGRTTSRSTSELPRSEHIINTLDAQPIFDAVSSQLTFIIQVPRTVNQDNPTERFQKITAQEDKWKIASDCFPVARC
ncbi:AAEL007223-PA, partial [Aedes aegypti]